MSSVRRVRKRAQALVFAVVVLCCCAISLPRLLRRSPPGSRDLRASIVLTAYETTGLRPDWLREICERYSSPDYASLVRDVVLVWNNPAAQLPPGIPSSVKVIRSRENSLNNRCVSLSQTCTFSTSDR